MPTRLLVLAVGLALAWPGGATLAQARPAHGVPHRAHLRHARLWRPYRGAYHIPRFDQAEAEAEVHTQYRYRTPYLPYWVFP